jgi:methionine--tRNA ligase beta chain
MAEFQPAPVKPLIPVAALEAVDVRVGTVRAVEDVPGSDKLVRLRVGFGDRERVILAGLKKERADAKALAGVQALFVVNLEPRKMMGEVSEGMLFDLGYADGLAPALAVPERPVPDGTRAG